MLTFRYSAPAAVETGALALLCATDGRILAEGLPAALTEAAARARNASRFRGETAEMLELLAPAYGDVGRVLLVGVGDAAKIDAGVCERIGGALAARLNTSGESALTIIGPPGADDTAGRLAACVAFGYRLRGYRFDRYRTKEPTAKKPSVEIVTIQTRAPAAAEAEHQRLAAVADGVAFARDLVSEPANILYPETFVERCMPLADLGVRLEILDEARLHDLGFGALLGVAQGSARPARVLVMEWDGLGQPDATPLVLIGKGVTFDTGGISIKPAAGMEQMKWDMGGAGAVAGAMRALAGRKARARVIGLCGLVENMPSGTAQRPGDVVTSLSGQTVEVINTDAEGRLVLCDVMTYAQDRFKPAVMLDLATLTGAMIISLGHEFAGLFANDDDLARDLVTAGFATGDKLWRFPLGEAYDKLIASQIADMKNVGPREAGSITAAQYLKRFVKEGVKWAHLDIAGMVWAEKDGALWEKGATGYGVRLLDRYVADQFEAR